MDISKFIKRTEEPIALVLGRYVTIDLAVVRSLGKINIPILVLTPNAKYLASFSKYYKGTICPDLKHDEKKYIDFLLDFGKNLNTKGVLLPNGDAEVSVILRNKDKLEDYYKFPCADFDVVEKLLNKRLFYETINKFDISCPKTYIVNKESDVKEISKEIVYPTIVKPVFSDYFRSDFKIKLFRVNSYEELIEKYKLATMRNHEVIIQEIIPGGVKDYYGFDGYYDKNYDLHGSFMYHRLREWPHNFGNGCFIESIRISELEEIITELVKKIGYHGIIDAEFKKDNRDNKYKIIEINPRCWMQNGLPARCGINFPYMAYMGAIGRDFGEQVFNGEHVKWLFMSEDLISSLTSFRERELSLNEWINSYKGNKEFTIFSWDDPIPFFVVFAGLIYGLFKRI
jgi:predicted ATP-grasp superfamily ATP-dependent carboligase